MKNRACTDLLGPCILREDEEKCHEVGMVSHLGMIKPPWDNAHAQAEKHIVASTYAIFDYLLSLD